MKSTRSNGAPVVSTVVGVRSKPSLRWCSIENKPEKRSRRMPASATALTSPRLPPDSSPRGIERRGGIAGDHVDHAADRVGTVQRRRGALHHFDLLQAGRRLAIEVDHAALDAAGAEQRLAVEQDQHLARVDAPGSARRPRRRFRLPRREIHAGHLAQQLRRRFAIRFPRCGGARSPTTLVFSDWRSSSWRDADTTCTSSITGRRS